MENEKTTLKTQMKLSFDDPQLVDIYKDGKWHKVTYNEALRFILFEDKFLSDAQKLQ